MSRPGLLPFIEAMYEALNSPFGVLVRCGGFEPRQLQATFYEARATEGLQDQLMVRQPPAALSGECDFIIYKRRVRVSQAVAESLPQQKRLVASGEASLEDLL